MSSRRLLPKGRKAPRHSAPWPAFAMMALCAAIGLLLTVIGRERTARTTADLQIAARQLRAFTERPSADDQQRAAIAWGYSERLRLGLESPFRLVEAAARDPRLLSHERRTVSRGLLARVL